MTGITALKLRAEGAAASNKAKREGRVGRAAGERPQDWKERKIQGRERKREWLESQDVAERGLN